MTPHDIFLKIRPTSVMVLSAVHTASQKMTLGRHRKVSQARPGLAVSASQDLSLGPQVAVSESQDLSLSLGLDVSDSQNLSLSLGLDVSESQDLSLALSGNKTPGSSSTSGWLEAVRDTVPSRMAGRRGNQTPEHQTPKIDRISSDLPET